MELWSRHDSKSAPSRLTSSTAASTLSLPCLTLSITAMSSEDDSVKSLARSRAATSDAILERGAGASLCSYVGVCVCVCVCEPVGVCVCVLL